MKKENNKSGFTLLEIIVVLVIVGILAAIAIPNYFNSITRSNANAVFTNMSALKAQVEACVVAKNIAPTDNFTNGPCSISSLGPISYNGFTFDVSSAATGAVLTSGLPATGNLTYTLLATDVANHGGNAIFLIRNTDGSFSCNALQYDAGPYVGVC